MKSVIIILLIWIVALIPILLWAYLFSYLDNSNLNIKRFISWIIWWWISVIPVLYMENITNYLNLWKYNIFSKITFYNENILNVFLSVFITIIIVSIFMYIWWLIYIDSLNKINKVYIKNSLITFIFWIFLTIIIYLINSKWLFKKEIADAQIPVIWTIISTLWAIIIYYLIIWLLEESSKHFWFLSSSLSFSENLKKWVIYWVFIALWFWFIENILYLVNSVFYQKSIWTIFSILFFRSLFSVFVHIFCSVILLNMFLKAYFEWKKWFEYIKTFLYWISLSIIIHAVYDISLTIWFSLIVFIYFFIWYLFITKIFYKEKN